MSSARLRIAHVTLGLATGGQEKLLVEFARHTDRERFELLFVSLTNRGLLAETLESLGARVITLDAPGGLRPRLIWRLRKLFRAEKIDVVHTHDDRPLIYGVPAGRWAGVRRVIHTQHHGLIPGTSNRQNLLVRWASRLAHAFVTVSHDSAQHYAGLGVPASKVTTIWNGIDLQRFAEKGPTLGGPVVTVARLSPEKDIANLLEAAAVVRKTDPNFRLEIAGDGPCRNDLAQLAHARDLDSAVSFLGEVREIPALLGRASLFVLPSKTEGISLTLLEAMARGLPIVATRVGGNPEVVEDGKTGHLVSAQDSTALAAAILKLRSDPIGSQQMGHAGRRRVEEHFEARAMVARYERLYETHG